MAKRKKPTFEEMKDKLLKALESLPKSGIDRIDATDILYKQGFSPKDTRHLDAMEERVLGQIRKDFVNDNYLPQSLTKLHSLIKPEPSIPPSPAKPITSSPSAQSLPLQQTEQATSPAKPTTEFSEPVQPERLPFNSIAQQSTSESATSPKSKRVTLNPLPMAKPPSTQSPPMPQAKPTSQPPPSTPAQPSPSYVSFMQQPITTGASAPDVSSQNGQGMSDFKDAVREFRDAIREVKQLIQTMAGQGSQQGAGGFKMPPGGLPIPKQSVPRTSGDRSDRVPSVMSGQALGFLAQVFRALS